MSVLIENYLKFSKFDQEILSNKVDNEIGAEVLGKALKGRPRKNWTRDYIGPIPRMTF